MSTTPKKIETPFKVAFDVPQQRVWDLLCCGMESGSYGSFIIEDYENECGPYRHIDTPFNGGTILLKDKYGDSEEVYRLDREALQRGLTIMAERYPSHMSDFINENEDAVTGDVFIQCALLGEIVYS